MLPTTYHTQTARQRQLARACDPRWCCPKDVHGQAVPPRVVGGLLFLLRLEAQIGARGRPSKARGAVLGRGPLVYGGVWICCIIYAYL